MRRLLPALLLFVVACQPGPEHRKVDAETLALIEKHDAQVPALVLGNNDFALSLYQQLALKDGNLIFSPYSISNALAMTYAGARGNTATEMKSVLRFRLDDETLHPTFGNLILKLEGDGKPRPVQLDVANRLWGQKNYGFVPGFLKLSRDFNDGGLVEVDYQGNPEAARNTINAWVARQTRDKIKDLIAPGMLTNSTRLVLTNAIYFKAPWETAFKPEATRTETFHRLDGQTVQTPMMRATHDARFADFEQLSLVELAYKGGAQSMIVILPKKNDGLPDLEKELTTENLTRWTAKLAEQKVDLKLPKFKMTVAFKVNDELVKMGMRDAFDSQKADFSGIADDPLFISAVLHKAFVDVNEEGTEAAAATAVIVETESEGPKLATFHADHPFVFLIRDRASGTTLFMGRVTNPLAK